MRNPDGCFAAKQLKNSIFTANRVEAGALSAGWTGSCQPDEWARGSAVPVSHSAVRKGPGETLPPF